MLEISNSYIFCLAEDFLLNDLSLPCPSHILRLTPLQNFLKIIFNLDSIKEIDVYMCSDYYEDNNFEDINCSINHFADIVAMKLKDKISYAYKYILK